MRVLTIVLMTSLLSLAPASAIAQGSPSEGARLASDARLAGTTAGDKAALSDQWKKGARMTADGEKLMRQSEAKLQSLAREATRSQERADAATSERQKQEASQTRGQQMIDQGRSLQAQAEANVRTGSGQ